MKTEKTCAILITGLIIVLLSYTVLADEKPLNKRKQQKLEVRQKQSAANKSNLQVQRRTTCQSETEAGKIEPSRQQKVNQARQRRRQSHKQDPINRFFDLRFKDLTDQQWAKLEEIRLNFKRDMIEKPR